MTNTPFCVLEDLINESDVEQKFILPLLVSNSPIGFGYTHSDYRTKPDIRKILIDKGANEKLYFPDYVIVISGLPLMIIEAKAPGEDLEEAMRQARLYANELNYKHPKNIDPCRKIIATDGHRILFSYVDSQEYKIEIDFANINPIDPTYNNLLNLVNRSSTLADSKEILSKIRGGAKFIKPKQLLGGKTAQGVTVKENSFGSTLSFEFRNIFNPQTGNERRDIVENAYVTTKRILRHVQPIEKIIRRSSFFGEEVNKIDDTEYPTEIIEKFRNRENLRNELILLIGGVGSGKSTFTDYLRLIALPDDIKDEIVWINIDLNTAPLNKEEIYLWLKLNIIDKLISKYPEIDFEERDVLLKLYGPEFKALRKGAASFFDPDSYDYKKLFADKLLELDKDPDKKSKSLVRYLCSSRRKLFVIMLDNCDKRKAEEQLLMFEVATWLKEYYQCLIFLPLRDTTFSIYRKQKPLDTVIKDLVFRIDPPLLREVIINRVRFTLRKMSKGKKTFTYELSNGMKVEYPQSEQGLYLASIVRSLFENAYFNRLISGIAGKDIRKGLEVFLNFCRSGHIDESEILKMKKFGSQYIIKNHTVSKIILRGDRRYFSGEESIIKNIFASYPEEDELPNPFTRLFILKSLNSLYFIEGPSRMRGFHTASSIISDIVVFGHDKNRVIKEINALIKYGLIITESQSEFLEDENDLISISSYGMIHVDLLNDTNYISACAEDMYFRDQEIASTIYKRISGKLGYGQFSFETTLENCIDTLDYLKDYRDSHLPSHASEVLSEAKNDHYSLVELKEKVLRYSNDLDYFQFKRIIQENPPGKICECVIVSIQQYGIFVEFGLEYSGFVHISSIERLGKSLNEYEMGDSIVAEIETYNESHNRFQLKYIRDFEYQEG